MSNDLARARSVEQEGRRLLAKLVCPFCGDGISRVVDTWPLEDGSAIRRRRECFTCGERFDTSEKITHPAA